MNAKVFEEHVGKYKLAPGEMIVVVQGSGDLFEQITDRQKRQMFAAVASLRGA